MAYQVLHAFDTGRSKLRSLGQDPIRVFLGVEHLTIDAPTREVEWTGRHDSEAGSSNQRSEGQRLSFDYIILANGFGIEHQSGDAASASYWRSESYAQPVLDGSINAYAISGYGDGALIDLARLTIQQFRQDRIINELFESDELDDTLASSINEMKHGDNFYDLLQQLEKSHLKGKVDFIRKRLRSDTKVGIYLAGERNRNRSFRDVFSGGKVSFINRMIFYLLFRCGAFVPIFDGLDGWMVRNNVPSQRRIFRHGTDVVSHLLAGFSEPHAVGLRIRQMRLNQAQRADPIYPLDFFTSTFGG